MSDSSAHKNQDTASDTMPSVTPEASSIEQLTEALRSSRLEIARQQTALEAAQHELSAAHAKYADLYDTAPIGFFTINADGIILEANQTAATMLSTDLTRLANRRFAHYIAGADYATYQSFLQELFATEAPGHCELRLVDQHTNTLDVRIDGVIIRHEVAQRLCRFSVSNIADHKQAQQALKATRHHLETILSHIPVVLFVIDQDGIFTLWVGKEIHDLGIQGDDLAGKSAFEVYAAYPALLDDFRRALVGENLHITHEINNRNFEMFCNPIQDDAGNIYGVIGVAADMTERERTATALRRSEERFNLAVQGANDGIWDWNILTNEMYYSPRCKQLLGYNDDEIPNMREAFDNLTHPADLPDVHATLEDYLQGELHEYQVEYRALHKNGQYRWIMCKGACIWDAGKRPYRMVGTFSDITELKRAEQMEYEQRVLAEALQDTAAALSSSLDFDEVLDMILIQVERVVPHDFASITLIADDTAQTVRQRRTDGRQVPRYNIPPYPIKSVPALRQMIETRQPVIFHGMRHTSRWKLPQMAEGSRSYLGAPIIREDAVIGFIELYSYPDHTYTSSHGERLKIFADQAAIAINNARLYEQAQQLAALVERQRLARDLHDAVNQTLFSASVIAEALPRVIERNPEQAEQLIQEIIRLTRGALSEMRTLLFELRPDSLENASLSELIEQLGNAFSARTRTNLTPYVVQQKPLPTDVKIVFYRIAQEALTNVAKHARATDVILQLIEESNRLELRITDNGRGFNTVKDVPGHFGLTIMRERAESIGAELTISAKNEEGVEVLLTWERPGTS